jgi:cytochrome P450
MTRESSKNGAPPGPPGLPFLGNVLDAWRDPLALFVGSRGRYGDLVRFKFGPLDYYLVSDPDLVHHVLVENHKAYVKSRNYAGLKLVLGQGLLTSEGDFWRSQRKLAQPAFHRQRMSGFVDSMAGDTAAMLERWDALPDAPIDAHAEMMRLTLRIVGHTLFSTDVDGEASAVGAALNHALAWTNHYVEALISVPPWVPTPENLRFKRSKKTLDDMVFRIIDARQKSGEDAGDLLGMLMAVRDEETREGMTARQLRDEVMTLVVAGHETTANLLAWAFYLLSEHPDVARRVKAEVDEVLGDRVPVLADLPRLGYTKRVLEESLRLYPPAWVFERQAILDDVLGGFRIPKGSILGISPWCIHRSPALWDDPERFDPERFLPDAVAARPKFAYLPFGGGPRFCIGNGFAMMEAQIIVAMIVQRWSLALVPGHPVVPDPLVTLRPRHGMQMTLSRAPRGAAPAADRALRVA